MRHAKLTFCSGDLDNKVSAPPQECIQVDFRGIRRDGIYVLTVYFGTLLLWSGDVC